MSFKRTQDQHKKLFVGGLNVNTTTDTLRQYYEQFGSVSDAIVMRDPMSQRSRCFGFVTFENEESIDVAQAARPHIIDEKQVDSKRAIPKDDVAPESRVVCNKVFVGGLRKDITDDQLREYFSQYGTITECFLTKDKVSGLSRGFGFVTFDDTDVVDKVIIARPHTIADSKADVKKALPKDAGPPAPRSKGPFSPNYSQRQYNAWEGNYGQPAENQGWNAQGYGSQMYPAHADPNGWSSYGYAQPGAWGDTGANAASGFGAYAQQPEYGGGPMRAGMYGSAPAAPYTRR